MMEGDLAAAEVALQAVRVHYSMLVRMWENNCDAFLDWQASHHVLEDLGELRDVGLSLDDNNLPFI